MIAFLYILFKCCADKFIKIHVSKVRNTSVRPKEK